MKKQELLTQLSEKADLTKADAQRFLDALTLVLHTEVKAGNKVSLPQIGHFEVKDVASRTVRNPKTGESFKSEPTKSVKFKLSKTFKESVRS